MASASPAIERVKASERGFVVGEFDCDTGAHGFPHGAADRGCGARGNR
jgi:hypothetical protein